MDELELERLFRTLPALWWEQIRRKLDVLRVKMILKAGWRRVGNFRSVLGSTLLPCIASFAGRGGCFCSAGRATIAQLTATAAKPTLALISLTSTLPTPMDETVCGVGVQFGCV